jgi:hypothetical protein
MYPGMKRFSDVVYLLVLALLLLGALLIIFDHAMLKGYFRDENQFVASGKLLKDEGLLPYRDYPYFHMPNLAFIYALIYQVTDFTLLGARSFSVLCAWGAMAALLYAADRFFQHHSRWLRLAVGAGGVLLILPNPLFRFTVGLAWNHDFPVLLTLVAALVLLRFIQSRDLRWLGLSGFLLGTAVGTRLTFLTAVAPFLGTLALFPDIRSSRNGFRGWLFFGAGFLIAMLPSIILFLSAPREFIFGNVQYAWLNTLYRQASEFDGPMTFTGKLVFLSERVLDQPGTITLLAMVTLFAIFGAAIYLRRPENVKLSVTSLLNSSDTESPYEGAFYAFLFSLPVFLLVGSFLPTPSWYQYFYAPLPFIVLGILYGLSQLDRFSTPAKYAGLVLFFLSVLLVNYFHFDKYPHLRSLARPGAWYPIQTHIFGYKIKTIVGEGRVLTLSPLFPLDGGASIFPQYATGPFAWRVGDLLTEAQRETYKMMSKDELVVALEENPPGGILVGPTKDAEVFLLEYARQRGYNPVEIYDNLTLWVPN